MLKRLRFIISRWSHRQETSKLEQSMSAAIQTAENSGYVVRKLSDAERLRLLPLLQEGHEFDIF